MTKGSSSNSNYPTSCEVIIVGAGVAGASAAYHLSEAGVSDILIIDGGSQAGEAVPGRPSGSAVMQVAPTIKMMVQVFASGTKDFIAHHGEEGARRYLSITAEGLKLQKELAKSVALESPSEQLRELGSYYVAYKEQCEELQSEFETLKSLGCHDIEWYDKGMLAEVPGSSPDFHCAIFFPNDAVIDSSSYAKGLVRAAQSKGSTRLLMNTTVSRIAEEHTASGDCMAVVELESGAVIRCQHVVIATGGLFQVPELSGVLNPCYSYLVHVPVEASENACEYSSNFFTWGFTHDWCFTNGKVRTSGEDHFSAYKDPRCAERCGNLLEWTLEKYGCGQGVVSINDIPFQFGVYSETPDSAPLLGSLDPGNSRLCFLLGCNAWGQTVLSYSSSLIPGLLGYSELNESQKDSLKLLSIDRFGLLPKLAGESS
jgi:glycine/D-amino acid oxidase-like deaminating enzyme